MDVSEVLRIDKEGNKIIGKRETTPKGRPSFVHNVTKRAISPSSDACFVVKTANDSRKTKAPIRTPAAIFLN
jgi:hypothetical protein